MNLLQPRHTKLGLQQWFILLTQGCQRDGPWGRSREPCCLVPGAGPGSELTHMQCMPTRSHGQGLGHASHTAPIPATLVSLPCMVPALPGPRHTLHMVPTAVGPGPMLHAPTTGTICSMAPGLAGVARSQTSIDGTACGVISFQAGHKQLIQ